MLSTQEILQLVPLATEWMAQQEKNVLAVGEQLTTAQINEAKSMGVAHPEKVRILYVPTIPQPTDPQLAAASEQLNFLTAATIGLSLRYGIYKKRLQREQSSADARIGTHNAI